MTEVRLHLPEKLMRFFKRHLGSHIKATDVAVDAMDLFAWAFEETARGRAIISSDPNGKDVKRVSTPVLDAIPPRRPPGRPMLKIVI